MPPPSTGLRSRYNDRSTRHTVDRLFHIDRLGKIDRVVGKRYKSTRSSVIDGERRSYTFSHECVMVYGENGTARYEGLCWSYSGEGPRGLAKLLERCGATRDETLQFAYETPRKDVEGVDWVWTPTCKG